MLITRRLKLLAPLLAAKRTGKKGPNELHREFVRVATPKGEPEDRAYIKAPAERWHWAFLEARDSLELEDVATSSIIPCRWLCAKRTSTYNRKFRRGQGGPMLTERFECLSSGQVFEMQFTLSRYVPPGHDGGGRFNRAPDEEEFDAMLAYIGERLGMSEWGQHYLHGRFEIQAPYVAPDKKTKEA